MPAGEIADMCHNLGIEAAPIVPVADAVAFAESKVQDHQVIVVAGSIFLAAAGKEIWQATHPQQGGN
jgi:folylpolyglutamate synthase/dihydropteroate synthase